MIFYLFFFHMEQGTVAFDSKYKIKYIFAESNDWIDTSSALPKIIDNNKNIKPNNLELNESIFLINIF